MFLLGAGYLAGLLVALKFNKKSPKELEKDFAPAEDRCNTIGKNLLEIHKNLLEMAQETLFSPENKKRIEEYRELLLKELESFQQEAEVKLEEWKKKGFEKKDEIEAELLNLYNRRMEVLEEVKQKGLSLLDETREEGVDIMEEGKKVAARVFDEAKKQLDIIHADIKKQLNKKK